MNMILTAGPWVGEFGYEMFEWQAAVRHRAQEGGYEHVVVASRPGHNLLYQDFCTQYIEYNQAIGPCEGRFNSVNVSLADLTQQVFKGIPATTIMCPEDRLKGKPQSFVKYGNSGKEAYDVLIHARRIKVDKADMVPTHNTIKESRNWDLACWVDLVQRLQKRGKRIACIGHPDGAYYIPGTHNYLGVALTHLADILASSELIVGPSSGPMHFATLCGCKQVVWGSAHLKPRYEVLWNPLGTPVHFFTPKNEWNPSVDEVHSAIAVASY